MLPSGSALRCWYRQGPLCPERATLGISWRRFHLTAPPGPVRISSLRKAAVFVSTVSYMRRLCRVLHRRDSACGVVSSRPWNGGNNFRAFAGDVLRRCEKGVAAAKERYTQGDDLPVPGKETQACNSTSLANLVEEALKNTAEFGTCSMGLLSFDNAG